jgi:hypothetical protein
VQEALPVDDVGGLLEALAPDAVEAGVGALVEVVGALREDALEELLHRRVMRGVRGADELVVREPERGPHRLEARGDAIDELLRREAGRLRGLRDLLAVLVHADQEPDVVTEVPVEAADGVGADLLEGVPEMRVAVGVVDGGREVEAGHGASVR